MPHIIVEYSDHLRADAGEVMRAVHRLVSECGLFDPQAVKARALAYSEVALPEGARNFLHVCVRILDGRSEAERARLSRDVFAAVKAACPAADRLSVEIHEMCRATYTK